MRAQLIVSDCLAAMRAMPKNSIDAIVTDPPYGIGFMNSQWDAAVPGEDWARECLRVLKPGGHLIAFAATRTIHRLTVALEEAQFEIRDQIAHIQFQGFPKSLDASKAIDALHGAERTGGFIRAGQPGGGIGLGFNAQCDRCSKWKLSPDPCTCKDSGPATPDAQRFAGYGTALKPAFEPAVLARKPLSGTVAANCLEWGTGCLSIDKCRYAYGDPAWPGPQERTGEIRRGRTDTSIYAAGFAKETQSHSMSDLGRWPANIYACPKPSRSEREQGCEELPGRTGAEAVERKEGTAGLDNPRAGAGRTASEVKNYHPTVKPVRLMRWLVRLVSPPALDGVPPVVLDPFLGSGTTGVAAMAEGVRFIGIEMSPEYMDIAEARMIDTVGALFSNQIQRADRP